MSDWQPIETAPRDGRAVFLLSEQGPDVGFWDDYNMRRYPSVDENGRPMSGEWCTELGNGEPTHWMPLPPPPEA